MMTYSLAAAASPGLPLASFCVRLKLPFRATQETRRFSGRPPPFLSLLLSTPVSSCQHTSVPSTILSRIHTRLFFHRYLRYLTVQSVPYAAFRRFRPKPSRFFDAPRRSSHPHHHRGSPNPLLYTPRSINTRLEPPSSSSPSDSHPLCCRIPVPYHKVLAGTVRGGAD